MTASLLSAATCISWALACALCPIAQDFLRAAVEAGVFFLREMGDVGEFREFIAMSLAAQRGTETAKLVQHTNIIPQKFVSKVVLP